MPVTPDQSPTNQSSTGQNVQCYKCKQFGHKNNNPICPIYNKSGKRDNSSGPPVCHKPKDPWKYVEPRDLSNPVIINGKKWSFCTKCKYRSTGHIRFYQLSHIDETNDPNWKPEGNHTPNQDPDPTLSPPLRPLSLAPASLEDDLVFTGLNYAPVLETNKTCDEREKTEGALWTKHCHSKNTRFVESSHRTYIVDATNIIEPSNGPPTEFSNLANYVFPLCKPCTEVHSVTTATKHSKKNWNFSTMNAVLQYYKLVLTMLWAYVRPLLGILVMCFSKLWEYYNLQLKVWTLLLTSSVWCIMRVLTTKTHHRLGSTKKCFPGFPAKGIVILGLVSYSK